MKISSRIAIVIGTLVATSAFAGNEKGNGGGAHVCAGSVEMYDLYEGRERYRLTPNLPSADTADRILEAVLERTAEASYENSEEFVPLLRNYIRKVRTNIFPTTATLVRLPDANELLIGRGCQYEQLANWDDRTGKLFVDDRLFSELRRVPAQEAALILHEAVYALARSRFEATTSTAAREVVARMIYGQNLRRLLLVLEKN